MTSFFGKHPAAAWSSVGIAVAVVVFVMVWFQPHKLFLEETVDEALPVTTDGPPAESQETGSRPTSQPSVLSEGDFRSLEHETTGTAQVIELSNGDRFLRFEDLSTSNGPDLRVYLSEVPESDDWYAYGERYVDLGSLKGNRGSQNYRLPDDLDLSRYESAVIWCRRFTVGFGVAGLSGS
jgi:hypothetical protein